MKQAIIPMFYSKFFRNTISFAMTLTKLLTVIAKKTLIFSKNGQSNSHKTLEINVNYRIGIKKSHYPIDLLLVFQIYLIFSN